MGDELKITITVRGVLQPTVARTRIVMMLKRALYLVDGIPGKFTARIDGAPGGSIELDENREWRRVRDSNSRGCDPNTLSGRAP